ncbi:MAG: cytochrome b [Candidatus Rariloculaceae bacterium]
MLRNTEATYGSVAKWLHWIMALWVLTAYVIIYYLQWGHGGEGPMRSALITYHKGVGFSILIPLAIRIFWRATNPAPKHVAGMPAWQINASRISHFLLYFFLLAMPVTGYIGNGVGVSYGDFRVTPFQETSVAIWAMNAFDVTYEELEVPFDTFHYRIAGPFILWVFVLIHASAAIYHHVALKDNVLARMLPRKN